MPIIRKEMQSFLKLLLAIKKPERILEVGTAVGFFRCFDGGIYAGISEDHHD